jgi:hypothetical protein
MGGVITAHDVLDLYTLDVPAGDPRWDEIGGKQLLSHRDCARHGQAGSPCAGPVEYRDPLSPIGRRRPYCEKHWAERIGDCPRADEEASANS